MKTCTRCHADKDEAEFYRCSRRRDGFSGWCRTCTSDYKKSTLARDAEAAKRRRKSKTPEQRRAEQVAKAAYSKKYRAENAERVSRHNRKARNDVVEAYGGKCACCGEAHHEFLAIDHIHGDGAAERAAKGMTGTQLYRKLRKAGYPKDRYRLLCHNCNMARGLYGYCPHERKDA